MTTQKITLNSNNDWHITIANMPQAAVTVVAGLTHQQVHISEKEDFSFTFYANNIKLTFTTKDENNTSE